ncbi:NADAR family protein [Taibaiella chishuiensis]|uniref:RibA/ribD-fused uncharacterized protein n=1 Tax=Taibaiella chishuiensis TaxID=1434707 RepID=A0A2P8DB33_9BACT|nr:NADAR family protein [Taibaiella chishuiensis]PSK94420.1 ribA/ribD-fused uncharacterized protein [Taibaiella chishuiensis]
MILPYTTYKTSKALTVKAYNGAAPGAVPVATAELAAGSSFRIALDNDPGAEQLQILPANDTHGLYYRISRQQLGQDCVLTTDFSTAIYFYTPQEQPFGVFSNFSPHGFSHLGQYFATAEHYYQSEKFTDNTCKQQVIRAATAKDAADLGKTQSIAIRPDWRLVKIEVMRTALERKFATHAGIRDLLRSTGERLLIENSPFDNFWGIGRTGAGKNHLGTLLMQLRATLPHQ